MLVLYWNSVLPIGKMKTLGYPIGVPDESLEAFGERLTREGGSMVTRLHLEDGGDGYRYIRGEERVFIGLAGTGTVRDFMHPVRREVD